MDRTFNKIILVAIILLLSACAQKPQQPIATGAAETPEVATSWEKRQTQLAAITQWTLVSAISIQQNEQVAMASLRWQQQGQRYTQLISGPMGIGGVRIVGQPGLVTLWKSAKQKITAKSPEELIKQQLGWNLPISNMYYWVRGLPVPNLPAEKKMDSNYRITSLQQQGWDIQYLAYKTINGVDLPQKIVLDYPALRVKLVISQWQV